MIGHNGARMVGISESLWVCMRLNGQTLFAGMVVVMYNPYAGAELAMHIQWRRPTSAILAGTAAESLQRGAQGGQSMAHRH